MLNVKIALGCLFCKIFLLFPFITFCQAATINGEVRDAESNNVLPYVTIGVAGKSVGTVSSKEGRFRLELNGQVLANDTIVFSHIGYEIQKIAVGNFSQYKGIVLLREKPTELAEVVFIPKTIKRKQKQIGRSSKGLGLTHFNFYTAYEKNVDDRLSKEVGMKLKIRRSCQLKDLNFYVSGNQFSSLKFRIYFYNIKNGLPGDIIIDDNVIVEIKNNYEGWVKVDLSTYKIRFGKEVEEDIAITMQWIESVKSAPSSKFFSISTASSPAHTMFYREKAMDTWKKSNQALSFYVNASCE